MGLTPVSWYSVFFFLLPNSPRLIFKKKKQKTKNKQTNSQRQPRKRKKKVKRWSKVAAMGPLCVFNYNIAIE